MKAHKQLNWKLSKTDGGHWVYTADCYLIYEYQIDGRVMWRLEGGGLNVLHADADQLKQRAQQQYNRERKLKAWENYMLTHEPPPQ